MGNQGLLSCKPPHVTLGSPPDTLGSLHERRLLPDPHIPQSIAAQRQRLREKRDEKMRSQSHAATGGALSEAELAVARRSAAVAAEELLRQEEEEAARAASRRAAKARKKKGAAL